MENLENEVWLPIKGYEGYYEVSNLGRVKSFHGSKIIILKSGLCGGGYSHVILCSNISKKTIKVHRLVLIAFIPNTENKRCVNHKNGIRTDNRLENLEWATHSENNVHAYNVLGNTSYFKGLKGIKNPNSKKLIDTKTNQIFHSHTEACAFYGIKRSHLSNMINGIYTNDTNLIKYE